MCSQLATTTTTRQKLILCAGPHAIVEWSHPCTNREWRNATIQDRSTHSTLALSTQSTLYSSSYSACSLPPISTARHDRAHTLVTLFPFPSPVVPSHILEQLCHRSSLNCNALPMRPKHNRWALEALAQDVTLRDRNDVDKFPFRPFPSLRFTEDGAQDASGVSNLPRPP